VHRRHRVELRPGKRERHHEQLHGVSREDAGPDRKDGPVLLDHVDATDGSWTSKTVFVAANAWSDAQATWLDAELAKPTTYTFLVATNLIR